MSSDINKKIYGLLGEKLGHSFSPKLHKMMGGYKYNLFEIEKENLKEFLQERKFAGINVTIPYKIAVISSLDEIDELAKEIGAVNTIVNKNGQLKGYNTDYYGFDYMCKMANISLEGEKVLILGSGGASKMVQIYAKNNKAAKVVVISRTGENNYNNLEKWQDFTCIINTTPIGMYPNNDGEIIDLMQFKNCSIVIDLIYNPLRTNLILKAQELGLRTATGLSMLVGQAYKAVQLFLDKEIPIEIMKKTLDSMQAEVENIVFIGMPGVGKTTIAKKIADILNRKLIPMDEMIELRENKSIPKIFKTEGEEKFRELESKLTSVIAKEKSLVIATGGGTPINIDNARRLKQNGMFVYLQRPIKELSTKGRPLSKNLQALEAIYQKRHPIYNHLADEVIEVKKYKKDTISSVLNALRKRGIL